MSYAELCRRLEDWYENWSFGSKGPHILLESKAAIEALTARAEKAEAALERFKQDRAYVVGFNDGWDNAIDAGSCPVCEEAFKPNDECATDIELGTCHYACLEGSPTVDLDTGEQIDGPIPTFRYMDLPTTTPDIEAVRAAIAYIRTRIATGDFRSDYQRGELDVCEKIEKAINGGGE